MSVNQLPNASLLRRIAAWVYDLFLLFAVAFAYGAAVTIVAVSLGVEADNLSVVERGEDMTLVGNDPESFTPFLEGFLFQTGLIAVLIGFYVLFWMKRGATLGMQTWRMELIDLDGGRPGFKTCVFRALTAILSFACFGLGYIWSLIDSEKRTAHDIVTGTRVVVHPKPGKS